MRRDDKQRIDEQVRRASEPNPEDVARLTHPDTRRVIFEEIISSAAPHSEVTHRPVARRPVLAAAAVALLTAGAGVAWAVTDRPPAPPAALPTTTPSTASQSSRYTAADLQFFAPLRPGRSAALKRQPETLDKAFTEATATVLAQVTNVRPGRTIGDPALQFIEVELQVTEVLRGALQPALNGVVRVEFTGAFQPDPIQPTIDAMRANIPRSPGVWLLRWQGEAPATSKPGAPADDPTSDKNLYRLVHPLCGVLVQDNDGVIAATAWSEPASAAQREAEELDSLEDVIAKARG